MFENIKEIFGKKPIIGSNVFVAESANVMGEVNIAEESSVWFQTVIRGDVDSISIGHKTNIQDLSMLHVSKGHPLRIGNCVTVGHHVVLHGCIVNDFCLIGIGAIINDGAIIGTGSVVAAGSLIPPGKVYPENSLIMGSPAKVKRELTEDERKTYHNHYLKYVETKNLYLGQR